MSAVQVVLGLSASPQRSADVPASAQEEGPAGRPGIRRHRGRVVKTWKVKDGAPIKAWIDGVPLEAKAQAQLERTASLPFIHKHLAVMPDVHWGMGSTVGSVIATRGAIIPAAVGVDIGCGMVAARTALSANDLPDSLGPMRSMIESLVPHGRSDNGRPALDTGSWRGAPSLRAENAWKRSEAVNAFQVIADRFPGIGSWGNPIMHLGTLGTGNHFIEVCLDEEDQVWVMLHSGSRGIGNRIGSQFIRIAKKEMERHFISLPDKDLAYLVEGSEHFDDYVSMVGWAQDYAALNRSVMLEAVWSAIDESLGRDIGAIDQLAINCHHNYVAKEHHFGENVWVTRKGAVRARENDLGIIPGSMGARSFIVRGKGNAESFHTCSHGAGRAMSRRKARERFTLEDHALATAGVECRKDEEVLDETPGAYKDIDAVMAAQSDLVEVVHTLRQVICVKG